MCGICGYLSRQAIEDKKLQEMNDTMTHRGPDDAGIWQETSTLRTVGLAQRRLSILDLSELGHQPMFSRDKRIVVVYNGEIYNYQQLRKELEREGFHFASNCDTEVLIAAYQYWGCECFRHFNGMFAAAILDKNTESLVLVRDRMGKKPLYYYQKDDTFVFGSELKPIMKYPGFKRNIRKDMVAKLLCSKYIEAPFSIFENTYKMIPGTYLIYQNGKTEVHTYWDACEKKEVGLRSLETDYVEASNQLDSLLQDAVGSRLIADVPVGTFLSGGIDSTLVTAIASKVSEKPVNSFSIGFYDKERNEAVYAAEIAKHIGTKHKELYIGEKKILELLQGLPYYYDEPFSDSSQLPTMMVSKMASEDITVALSGDGGDELFCGYKMYDWTHIAQRADFIGNILYHFPYMKKLKQKFPPELRAFINNRNEGYKTQLFVDVMIEEAAHLLGMSDFQIKYDYEKHLQYVDWRERRMLLDMMTYLPDEVLAKTDRASMRYSLEVRCPLLDYRIVEWSLGIPQNFKCAGRDKKHILKDVTYRYVPRELLDRPKKGFGVPLRKWLRTVLKKEVARYADSRILKKQDIFQAEAVQELIIKQEKSDKIIYSSMLWSFYVFQLWYQQHIEDIWNG